jgi:adenylosuccinate synthase
VSTVAGPVPRGAHPGHDKATIVCGRELSQEGVLVEVVDVADVLVLHAGGASQIAQGSLTSYDRGMPASVVIGGQFGSEGKGKVAQHVAETRVARAAVRVGGPNSGHTTKARGGAQRILLHLPTAAVLPDVLCVLPAGSYLNPEQLLREIDELGLSPGRVAIDPAAIVILDEDRRREEASGLGERIGSTCSGTGAAVIRRIERAGNAMFATNHPRLRPFVRPTSRVLRDILVEGHRVVVEGTQGFGLSLLHSPHYPNVTARDTTAAAAVSEAGLSPLDVDEVVLVLRAFPIRVAGNSGSFGAVEIDWTTIASEGGHSGDLAEYTSVTHRLRRVARFDPEIVRRAIAVNHPTSVVLNHVDYVDAAVSNGEMTDRAWGFVHKVTMEIQREIDLVGVGPDILVPGSARETLAV